MKFLVFNLILLLAFEVSAQDEFIDKKIHNYANSVAATIAENHEFELVEGTVNLSKKHFASALSYFVGLSTYNLSFNVVTRGQIIKKVNLILSVSEQPSESRMAQLAFDCLFHIVQLKDNFGTTYFVGVQNQMVCTKLSDKTELFLFDGNLETLY